MLHALQQDGVPLLPLELHKWNHIPGKKNSVTVRDKYIAITSMEIHDSKKIYLLVFLIEKIDKWRSLETLKRKALSRENSICVTVRLWDCKRPTAFHVPTSQSQISATGAD